MARNLDAAIAFLLAQGYEKKDPPPKVEKVKGEGKRGRKAKDQAPKVSAPLYHHGPLAAKGSLDAPAFLKAMRKAVNREEKIQAIAGFCGWNEQGEFGAQEWEARRLATRTIKPIQVSENDPAYRRAGSVDPTVKGYVAGMPDQERKQFQDLKSREYMCIEKIAEHAKNAAESEGETRNLYLGLQEVEESRLQSIRRDMWSY